MNVLNNSQTAENLAKSYSREMQVSKKYKLFSEVAQNEGYIEIAQKFSDISREEEVHAERFYKLLNNIFDDYKMNVEIEFSYPLSSTTEENLKYALLGENDVWRGLYPQFAEIAKNEGYNHIAYIFQLFGKAEKVHEDIFIRMYNDLRNGRYFKKNEKVKWICMKCGVIIEGYEPTEVCPGCLASKGYFKVYRNE